MPNIFVSNVVGDFLGDRVKSPELRNVEIESEENILKEKNKLMEGDDGLSANEAQFQAVQNETANLRNQISELQSKEGKSTKEKDRLTALKVRLKELTTGEVTTDVLSQRIFGIKNPTDIMFGDQIRQSLRREPVFPVEEYASKSNVEKLKTENKNTDTSEINFVDEKIIVENDDYYFSNVIARASKTMTDCHNEKIKLKNNGTDG